MKIKMYAQLQKIDGVKYEFQPEHLFCEECWSKAETAVAHANYFGNCTAKNYDSDHAMSVKKIKEGSSK